MHPLLCDWLRSTQARYLKFHLKSGEPILAYYKDNTYTTPQGEVQLRDSETGLVDPSSCEKTHQHQFQIKTAAESEHQGRTFYFSVESNKHAMDWVESARRHSGQISKRSSKGDATPIMAGMEVRGGR